MASIYLLEDEPECARVTQALLTRHGHDVLWFDTPHALFYQLGKHKPACVLVDWVLPEMPGIDVVVRVRQLLGRTVGILMLTAMDAEQSVVQALCTGADDYVVKPCADAVLLARVDALLRRLAPPRSPSTCIEVGPYRLDYALQQVTLAGQLVELTPREFDLAWMVFSHPSRLITRQELQAAIWGKNSELGSHTLAQHVYTVRKKFQLAKFGAKLVAVYASGYRLDLPSTWMELLLLRQG